MSEIGKYPLDDEDLEKVSGGVDYNAVCDCTHCSRINYDSPVSCSNCYSYNNGKCPWLKLLK